MAIDLGPRSHPERFFEKNYFWFNKRKELYNLHESDLIDHIDSENFSYDYARLSAVKFDYDYALVVKGDVKNAKESIVYK